MALLVNIPFMLLASSLVAGKLVARDATTYTQNAVCTNDEMMRYYDTTNAGLWAGDWWESAVLLATLADFCSVDSSVYGIYGGTFANTFANAPSYGGYTNFLDDYYDDEGWWALAWIDVYDLTGDSTYLNQAITIYNDIVGGVDTPCGGLWWSKDKTYIASIANALYIQLAAALARRVSSSDSSSYLNAAETGWNWFFSIGVVGSNNLVMDGVDPSTCQPEGALWTYNQGVILGAAAELYQATGNSNYLTQAANIANAVIASGSPLTSSSGILTEECGTSCNAEADMFKGAFIRNFRKLYLVDNNSNWASFIETNAQSIWNNDLDVANVNGLSECNTGPFWAGPYQAANEITQGAALAALVAAISASS